MRKALSWLPLLALATIGCVELPFLDSSAPKEAAKPVERPVVTARSVPRPVTADQINDGNARAMAQSLVEELDREEQVEPPSPRIVAPSGKKP